MQSRNICSDLSYATCHYCFDEQADLQQSHELVFQSYEACKKAQDELKKYSKSKASVYLECNRKSLKAYLIPDIAKQVCILVNYNFLAII